MRQEEFQKLLKRYKKGLCSPEEEALVEKWFRSMGSAEDPSLPESVKAEIKQRSWTRVRDHVVESKKKENEENAEKPIVETRYALSPPSLIRGIRSGPFWAIAAAILVVVVSSVYLIVGPLPQDRYTSSPSHAERNISNDTEHVMEVLLSDGSRVFLEPTSTILLQEPFGESRREVSLEGEAFFEVSRDTLRPFLVNTGDVVTKVLGTSFTVSAFPDDDNITVSVVTGKVSVMTTKDKKANSSLLKEMIVTPNQKIIYNRKKNIVSRTIVKEPVPILPAEVVKRMHFEAAPIKEIFEGLEQVYGVDIEFDVDIFSSCILTTSIADGNIYNRLDMICKAIDARYMLKEDRIVITGDGCDQ